MAERPVRGVRHSARSVRSNSASATWSAGSRSSRVACDKRAPRRRADGGLRAQVSPRAPASRRNRRRFLGLHALGFQPVLAAPGPVLLVVDGGAALV